MADQTVNIRLKIDDEGDMRRRTQEAKEYNKEAEKFNKGPAALSSMQYGRARGASGLTGASARDFANEQQGLGGLVRLYATVAANTYAAATAFNVLSRAMDTDTMVKGLDQLGARSGIALGTLAQNLVKATGGAISLKEAMTATAQGTSAGLTSAQMLRLTEVAQKASQALGVDVTDALNRLSRGVTKLEPELLDELGLFTKIGPATEAYARSIGKTANQLTDFERRQAFANAVLKEGTDKFGNIDLPANPYKELQASLVNLAQDTLSIVNTVVGPIASLLANNTGLLTAAIVGIGVSLARMAIPALGNWQKSLVESAALAKAKAKDINESFGDIAVNRINAKAQIPALKQAEENLKKDLDAARQEFASGNTRRTALAKDLMSNDKGVVNTTLATLDLGKAQKEINDSRKKANDLLDKEQKTQVALTQSEQQKVKIYTEHAANLQKIVDIKTKELDLSKKIAAADAIALEAAEKGTMYENLAMKVRAKISQQAGARSERLGIISKVAEETEAGGIGFAREEMAKRIAASKELGTFGKGLTNVQGTLAAVGTEIGLIGAAFAPWIEGGLALVTAFTILEPLLSSNTKQAEEFNSALENSKTSMDSVARTVAELDKGFGGFIPDSIQGLNAISNAFNNIADSMELVAEKGKKSKEAMNWWFDTPIDFIKSFVSQDTDSLLAKSLGEQVISGLSLLKRSGLKGKAEKELKESLGVESLDIDSVTKAFKRLGEEGSKKVIERFQELGVEAKTSSGKLQEFKSATEATTKAYQEFIQSTASNDPIFKLGASLQNLGSIMNKLSSQDIDEVKAAMIELGKSPESGVLFGTKFVQGLVDIRKELGTQTLAYSQVSAVIEEYEDKITKVKGLLSETGYKEGQTGANLRQTGMLRDIAETEKLRDSAKQVRLGIDQSAVKTANELFSGGLNTVFEKGSKLIEQGLGNASEQAALTIAKAQLGGLSGERRAREEARIANDGFKIQLQAIKTNTDLILATERLTAVINESNTKGSLADAIKEKKSPDTIARLQSGADAAAAVKQILGTEESEGVKLTTKNIDSVVTKVLGESADKLTVALTKSQLLAIVSKTAAQEAAKIKVKGEQTAAALTGQRAIESGKVEDIQKGLSLEQNINQVLQTRLGLQAASAGFMSEEYLSQQNTYEFLTQSNKVKTEILSADLAIKNAATAQEREIQKQYKTLILQRQLEESINLKIQQDIRKINNEYAKQNNLREYFVKLQDLANQTQTQSLQFNNELLALYDKLGVSGGEISTNLRNQLRSEQDILTTSIAKQAAQNEYNREYSKIQQQIDTALAVSKDANVDLYKTEQGRLAVLRDQKLGLADQTLEHKNQLRVVDDLITRNEAATKLEQKRLQQMQAMLTLQNELNALQDTGLEYLSKKAVLERQVQERATFSLDTASQRAQAERKLQEVTKAQTAAQEQFNIQKQIAENIGGEFTGQQVQDYIRAKEQLDVANEALAIGKQDNTDTSIRIVLNEKLFGIKQEILVIDNEYKRITAEKERAYKLDSVILDTAEQQLKIDKEKFDLNVQQGVISGQRKRDFDENTARAEAENKYQRDKIALDKEESAVLDKMRRDEQTRLAAGGGQDEEGFTLTMNNERALFAAKRKNLTLDKEARDAQINATFELSDRQQAYLDVFKGTFDKMTDVIVDFVKTGKLNHKQLIDSMLEGLLRYELEQQKIALYATARPGIASGLKAVGSFLGFGSPGYDASAGMAGNMGAAKGAAFNESSYPVYKFAMGGAFANSIVSSPTMFKFASGTGLMGEAGPEAIMPLKRDGEGNLGVRSQPSNVNVVVNNHSGQPAETRETMDSRGNRTIEVIVGDVVAQQIATKGSPVQQSMSNTYGNRPALARR
jgi:lambda family phage tail tape measure protein